MDTRRAFLFGLNYSKCPASCHLNGCINDVHNMRKFLTVQNVIKKVEVYTDESHPKETTALGMLNKLHEICVLSWTAKLSLVWIHYSGHGTYVLDQDGDELDKKDECLVPWDFGTSGVITDDYISKILSNFNPKTRVIFVSDSCHSGTIGDLRFSWDEHGKSQLENAKARSAAHVVTISGCLDEQTSADAYNVNGLREYSGALTSCMLIVLKTDYDASKHDILHFVDKIRHELTRRGFPQRPKLCTSFDIAQDKTFIPDL